MRELDVFRISLSVDGVVVLVSTLVVSCASPSEDAKGVTECVTNADCTMERCLSGRCIPLGGFSSGCYRDDDCESRFDCQTEFTAIDGSTASRMEGLCTQSCKTSESCPGDAGCDNGLCMPACDVDSDCPLEGLRRFSFVCNESGLCQATPNITVVHDAGSHSAEDAGTGGE